MLSLSEQLLLLSLHDEKGSVLFSASTSLPYGLAGALLLDLFLRNKIVPQGKNLKICDPLPTGDPILDEALSLIEASRKPRSAKYWVSKLSRGIKGLKQRTIEGLIEKQILKREKRRILWVFNVQRYPAANLGTEYEIRNRIRNIVLYDHPATEKEIALLSLVRACELVNEVFSKGERRKAKRKIKALTADEQIGKAISTILAEMTVAITTAVVAATVASSTSN